MQLMTFNSLLMFDIVFIFFLFLIVVTCLLYYLPPTKIKRKSKLDKQRQRSEQSVTVASSNSSKSVLYYDGDNESIESFVKCCKYCEKCQLIYEEIYSERSYLNEATMSKKGSCSNYLKAKDCDIKNCKGPIYEV